MTLFLVLTVALALLALWPSLSALLRPPTLSTETTDQKTLTLNILRQQADELKAARDSGELGEAACAQSQADLQRRVLEETADSPSSDTPVLSGETPTRARYTAWTLALLIPVCAALLYLKIGTPAALDGVPTPPPEVGPAQIEAMVERLAKRQQENPGNIDGWLQLARSYQVLGRHAEAVGAYEHALSRVMEDPDLTLMYAEALGRSSPSGLNGKPLQLIQSVLKKDPNQPNALLLAGAAAMQRKDKKATIAYWDRLLTQLEPGSELAQVLSNSLDRLKNPAATPGRQPATRPDN